MKRYTPEMVGQGKPNSGGVPARKMRFDVLDRIAKLGSGLTPAQKNDWAWFREAWDAKMYGEHDLNWGGLFCGWTQKVLDDLADGMDSVSSAFVHGETLRNFKEAVMLMVPAAADP